MSTIRVDNFGPSAGGTTYSARGIAKAWVNFDGTGTIAARDSENVSSLTDNGTGDYTVNFSSAFAAADDYSFNFTFGTTTASNTNNARADSSNIAASSVRFVVGAFQVGSTNALADAGYVTAQIHGDLA